MFVPFWAFSVHATAVYTAAVCQKGIGHLKSGQAGTISRDIYSSSTQVPATYHIRPDLAAGLKPSISHVSSNSWHRASSTSIEGIARQLTAHLTEQSPHVLPAAMHRGIAWEMILRALRAEEVWSCLACSFGSVSTDFRDGLVAMVHHRTVPQIFQRSLVHTCTEYCMARCSAVEFEFHHLRSVCTT